MTAMTDLADQVERLEGPLEFKGYAAVFGVRDAGRDIIEHGAFSETLKSKKSAFPLFWQHRPDRRIGWIVDAHEDERGLLVVGQFDDPASGEARAFVEGRVTGLSFGFRAREYERDEEGRSLKAVDLFEISLVTHPMQPMATAAALRARKDSHD